MRYGLLILALMTSWFASTGMVQAEVSVKVIATDPASTEITLGRNEPFYVRMEFSADEPVSIWARPYFEGKEVRRAKSNASFKHSGTGHALGWFSLDEASRVDEVRIKVGGGTPYREWEVGKYPVTLTATGLRAKAAWTDETLRAEAVKQRQEYEKRMNEPVSTGDQLFMSGFMLLVLGLLLGGIGAPAWAIWRWRGGWLHGCRHSGGADGVCGPEDHGGHRARSDLAQPVAIGDPDVRRRESGNHGRAGDRTAPCPHRRLRPGSRGRTAFRSIRKRHASPIRGWRASRRTSNTALPVL